MKLFPENSLSTNSLTLQIHYPVYTPPPDDEYPEEDIPPEQDLPPEPDYPPEEMSDQADPQYQQYIFPESTPETSR